MRILLPAGAIAGALCLVAAAQAESLRLTTLEWPPYVMADSSGASTDAVRETFARAGDKATVEVLPWNRAVELAANDPAWIGLYPEYYAESEDAEAGGARCVYSKAFGTSPVGFVHRADSDFDWADHADLAAWRIGVVRGYINEARFDAMVADGALTVDAGPSDHSNLAKVAAGRLDAAVIDRNVFEHLVATEADLAGRAGELAFHPTLLADHGLHVCFENTAAGRAARDRFDAAL